MIMIARIAPLLLCLLMLAACVSRLTEEGGHALYKKGHYQEALALWAQAAEGGDAGAAYRLAEEYLDAKVVGLDVATAMGWLEQAAHADEPRALMELGSLYDEGMLVGKDIARAARYYIRAARAGAVEAQYNAGVLYETGQGVEKDPVRAYMYYLLAREAKFFPFAPTALEKLKTELTPAQIEQAQRMAQAFSR